MSSSHEVGEWLLAQQEAGTIRACAHFRFHSVEQSVFGMKKAVFVPSCARRSFEWRCEQPIDLQHEAEILIANLHRNPIACPVGCLNYQSPVRARATRKFHKVWEGITAVGKWFDGQPWQVKLGLIGLLVIVLVPKWVPRVLELLKALHGN